MNPKDFISIHDKESASHKVIIYKEAPVTGIDQVNDFFDYLEEISENKEFHLIIDLSDTKPPSAEVRATLKNRFGKLNDKIKSYHVYIGSNILLKIAVQFVGASIGLRNFKTHNSIEKAVNYINEKIVT